MKQKQVDTEALQSFYKGLCELIGVDAMLTVYGHYKGSQLTIPTHLYDRKKAAKQVVQRFDGSNSMQLAQQYGYSQKWVRKIIRENKK